MANHRLSSKVEQLLGEPVHDSVAVVHQEKSLYLIYALLLIPLALQVNIWVLALLGGVAGAVVAWRSEYKIIARGQTRLVLLSAAALPVVRPTSVDRDLAASEVHLVAKGAKRSVTIGGRTYRYGRIFDSRLRAILGHTA